VEREGKLFKVQGKEMPRNTEPNSRARTLGADNIKIRSVKRRKARWGWLSLENDNHEDRPEQKQFPYQRINTKRRRHTGGQQQIP